MYLACNIPLFTSKKQRDNEIWCSLHNARIFSLWAALEPQQDLRQHLWHTCLHQLHFQSICRDHSKSTLKAAWLSVEAFQIRKLNPWTLASCFFGFVCKHKSSSFLELGWHQGRMSKAFCIGLVLPVMSSQVFKICVWYLDIFSGAVSVLVALLLRVCIFTDSQNIPSWKASTRSSQCSSQVNGPNRDWTGTWLFWFLKLKNYLCCCFPLTHHGE